MRKFVTGIRNKVRWVNALPVSDYAIEQVLQAYDELTPLNEQAIEDRLKEAFTAGRKAGNGYWSYHEWLRLKRISQKLNPH